MGEFGGWLRELYGAFQQEKQFRSDLSAVWGFCGSSAGKESACNARDPGWIPGSERSPGEGNSYPLQYSCLENPMERGVWQAKY